MNISGLESTLQSFYNTCEFVVFIKDITVEGWVIFLKLLNSLE